MGEFADCGLWMKLTFLMVNVGFGLDLFGMAMNIGGGAAAYGYNQNNGIGNSNENDHSRDAWGLLVTGFLFFLAAEAMILVLVHLDEMKGNKPGTISFIILSILAGLLTVIGIAVWLGQADHDYIQGSDIGVADIIPPYGAMVACIGSILSVTAGIFAVLDLAGVKAPPGGGGGGGGGSSSAPSKGDDDAA